MDTQPKPKASDQQRPSVGSLCRRRRLRQPSRGEQGSRQPMGIFWDIKSCPIPTGVNPANLAKNILAALRHYLPNYYPEVFFAYGYPGDFPSHLLSRWEHDGLTVHDVSGERGDYDLFIHMMSLAFDHTHPQAAGMVLISREPDHVNKLWRLGLLGHCAVLVCPSSEPFPESYYPEDFMSHLDWLSVVDFSDQPSVAAAAPLAVDG